MARWQIALVREQGVSFAVAAVKDHIIENRNKARELIAALSLRLGQPVVLLGAQRHRLYGRTDIVGFLQRVHLSQLPWRRVDLGV